MFQKLQRWKISQKKNGLMENGEINESLKIDANYSFFMTFFPQNKYKNPYEVEWKGNLFLH